MLVQRRSSSTERRDCIQQSNAPEYSIVKKNMDRFYTQPVKPTISQQFVTPKRSKARQENVPVHASRPTHSDNVPTAHVHPSLITLPSSYTSTSSARRDVRHSWSERDFSQLPPDLNNTAVGFDSTPWLTEARQQAAPRDMSTVVTPANVVLAQQAIVERDYPSSIGYQGSGDAYRGMYEHHVGRGSGGPAEDGFSMMLSHWQQRHQDQLRKQQLDVTQPVVGGNGGHAALYQYQIDSKLALTDPHKLDSIKRAADNIIKEKDAIIDKQKMRLMMLEQQTKITDDEMYRTSSQKLSVEAESLAIQLQEAKYDNASLKAALSETVTSKGANFSHLQKKLGETEYEMRQFQIAKEKQIAKYEDERKQMEEKLTSQKTELSNWMEKYEDLKTTHDTLMKKAEGMERYLADIPTPSAQKKQTQELRSLREEKILQQKRILEMEKRQAEDSRALASRDALIETLEASESERKQCIEQLQKEVNELKEKLSGNGLVPEVDLEAENAKLKADKENVRKLMKSLQRKQQQTEQRESETSKRLSEQLANEQAAVTALRDELVGRDQQLKKLRQSVKKLGRENEELLSASLQAKDRLQALEQASTGDLVPLQQQLQNEMSTCFADLRALVELSVQRADGHDPNISVLLGVRGASSGVEPECSVGDQEQCVRGRLTTIRQLQEQVDKLRELICSKYAEDIADNLNPNCTTQ